MPKGIYKRKPITKQHRENLSKVKKGNQNAKGYKQTEEHKNKNRLANSGKNHHNYIDGRSIEKHYCIDCGKKICYLAKRCQSCAAKISSKKRWQNLEFREQMIGIRNTFKYRKNRSGENSHFYKDGRCLQKNYCMDCGRDIVYDAKRCHNCASKITMKNSWQDGKMDGVFISPTKPEKQIIEVLEKLKTDYIFQFRPKDFSMIYDFYIPNMNLLIEFDGVYWHSLKEVKLRDIKKTEYANKNNYNLLRFNENNLIDFQDMISKKNQKYYNGGE